MFDLKQRSKAMAEALQRSYEERASTRGLRGRVNELFPIYAANSEYILGMNGYGVDLLGIADFRARLLACPMIEDGLQYWVPRRSVSNSQSPASFEAL